MKPFLAGSMREETLFPAVAFTSEKVIGDQNDIKAHLENVNASHGCFQSPQNHTKSMYNISYTDTFAIIAYKLKNIYIYKIHIKFYIML